MTFIEHGILTAGLLGTALLLSGVFESFYSGLFNLPFFK